MRYDKFTTKFQQALSDAQSLAVGNDQQFIEPQHLLLALLNQDDGSTTSLLQRAGVNGAGLKAALGKALELARQAGARHLVLRGDSDFAVRHLRGEAVTQVARLKVLIAAIRAQLDGFASARLEWVPRHRNPDADRLSRAALGLPDKPAEWPGIKRRRKRP